MNNKSIQASIIIIGNEILSGRTQDTNTGTLAVWLNSIGVKVSEVRVVPDVEEIIITTVNSLRKKYDYVFTTGGIGPTHDDIPHLLCQKLLEKNTKYIKKHLKF